MRLVTYYTPSHEILYRRCIEPELDQFDEVICKTYDQTCKSGDYESPGFDECMRDKLRCLLELEDSDEPTLYVDCDVLLFPGLAKWCSKYAETMPRQQIAFGNDLLCWCAGVMLFRQNKFTKAWWTSVLEVSEEFGVHDQTAMRMLHLSREESAETRSLFPIVEAILPHPEISNYATLTGRADRWNEEPFLMPKECLAWHCNFTVGVENKIKMLDLAHPALAQQASGDCRRETSA